MKLIKGFLFAIVGLFIMITLVSLLMPSKVVTIRTVLVQASETAIIVALHDLQQWEQWHPVFNSKPEGLAVSDPSKGKGASASWISAGKKNTLQIKEADTNHITLTLNRPGEKEITQLIQLQTRKDQIGIEVEWRSLTQLSWLPWEKFSGMFIETITGPGYEAALNSLKTHVEK